MTAEAAILKLLRERAPASICPSDAARALSPRGWRARMDEVRQAARRLEQRGSIIWTQRHQRIDSANPRGPVRFQLTPSASPPRPASPARPRRARAS